MIIPADCSQMTSRINFGDFFSVMATGNITSKDGLGLKNLTVLMFSRSR